MKTILTLFLIVITSVGFAQQGINYKALVKDTNGNVVANDLIAIQFQILQGAAMTNVYQESHTPTTDVNGIVTLNIGEGTTSDVFADIDWGVDDHFLNVQINTGGGLIDMGTTRFMAVPYAKHAQNAANAATKIDDLSDARSDPDGSSVFLGLDAGLNDDGTDNKNVAVGFEALSSNTTGQYNTANGAFALNRNTSGYSNTANGTFALHVNTTGYYNTANGALALKFNTTGNYNTAIGNYALYNNTSGFSNTAIGTDAGYSNTSGNGNIFIGYSSGYFETGNDKLYIANSSFNPLIYGQFDKNLLTFHGSVGISTKTPSTKLQIVGGTDATLANGSGYMVLGDEAASNVIFDNNEIMARNNGAVSSLRLQQDGGDVLVGGSVVHSSDRRLKWGIEDLPYGLNEILKLQAKAYNWKNREQDSKSFGLIAQEVEPILEELVSVNDPDTQMLGINYTELIPVLIKAIQEQQEIILKQNATIEDLRTDDEAKEEALTALDQRLKQLEIFIKPSN